MSKLNNALRKSFIRYSDKRLVSLKKEYVYKRYLYKDIYTYSLKFITLLKEKKIKPGERIAICAYNCPQYFYTFLGSIFYGVVLVPLDFSSSEELVKKFMKITDAKMLITSVNKVFCENIENRIDVETLDNLLENTRKGKINPGVKEDDLVEIMFTSGTTGEPKGVMLTHENLHENMFSVLKVLNITGNYRLISLLPLSHVFEQVAGFLIPILAGAQTVQLRSRRPSEIVSVLQHEKINVIVTVPAFFIMFKNKVEENAKTKGSYRKLKKALLLSSKLPHFLRRYLFRPVHKKFGGKVSKVLCGAASLPLETEEFWEHIGVKVMKGYGLTETSPVLTLTPENDRKLGSVGRTVPGVRLKLNKENEILCKGKNVTQGYYKNTIETKNLFCKGWMRTGDIGEIDEEGDVFIRGRQKNMILKPSGLNVYPEDIEDILNKHQQIKDSCVLGIDKGDDVEILAVLLLDKKTAEKKISKMIEDVNRGLEFHQKIQRFITWKKKDFPRTHTLKIKRREILAEVTDKKESFSETSDDLLHVLSLICHMDPKKIRESSRLYKDLGFDSLKIIELASLIEEKMGKLFDNFLIDSKTTVRGLRKLISTGRTEIDVKINRLMFSQFFFPLRFLTTEILYLLASPFIRGISVIGSENIKKLKTPAIFIINHTSHLDGITLVKHLPIRFRSRIAAGAAADYFFKSKGVRGRFMGQIFHYLFGAFPVFRDKKSEKRADTRATFEYISEILDRGWSLALAPEGTRARTGKMGPFKNGIGLIVNETEMPVVPVKLEGLFDIMPPHSKFPVKRGPARIKFGKPMHFSALDDPVEITQKLEAVIRSM